MPENKKERISILSGKITETTSSDSSVTEKYLAVKNQIYGLADPEIIIEGEALKPNIMNPSQVLEESIANDNQYKVSKFDHTSSRFALGKQRERIEKLKKTA